MIVKITTSRLFIIFVISFCLNINSSISQATRLDSLPDSSSIANWWDMMQNPHANFFETQKAFYNYFGDRNMERGSGYKQFKRWEYMMESRIFPDGTIPPPSYIWNNFKTYNSANKESFKSGTNWTELGPRILINGGGYDGIGRLNGIGFHPNDPNTIFVGSPSGGLWVSNDGGTTWTTHTDNLPVLGISDIKINQNNPDIMYIGTGDRDGGDTYGNGVMKSLDGGVTWDSANSGMGDVTVNMMVMDNSDPDIIIAATQGGIYKTINGGQSWSLKKSQNFKDIKYKPGDTSRLYATRNGGFYVSENSGNSWRRTGPTVLPGNARYVIGVTPANDSIVYVAAANGPFSGLFESRDFGETFSLKSDSPNIMGYALDGDDDKSQGSYDFCMAVDPNNENIIYVGGINVWRSNDAGVTWTCIGHWTGAESAWEVHADQHTMFFSPTDGKLYVGNDGGIYVTADNGFNWEELTDGLGISQVYKIGQSATWREKVINGYQDNGTMTYIGSLLQPWMSTGGGDGMECVVDYINSEYSYGTIYYGDITRFINNSSGGKIAGEDINGINESGDWVTPFCLHEGDPNVMFIGYKNIWRSKNVKEQNSSQVEWEKISNLLITNNENIRVVESSPANPDVFYFVRQDNTLFRSDNIMAESITNLKWTNLTDSLPNNSRPTDLEAHPFNEDILYMVQAWKVYKSVNKGNSWEDISGSLPDIPKNDIAFDLSSVEGLYVATDAGVYFKEGSGIDWVFYGQGLPASLRINEIEIYQDPDNRDESRLRIGTYGRGLWEAPLGHFSDVLPPYNLETEAFNAYVTLEWEGPFYTSDISGYNIYRDGEIIFFSTVSEYTDVTIINDSIYYYYVTSVNSIGTESQISNTVIAEPIGPKTIPYTEDFENGDDNWEYKNTITGWKQGTSTDLGMEHAEANQTSFFGINSVVAGNGKHTTDSLISPVIDLSSYINITLSFDYLLRKFLNYDRLWILYRVSENSDWIEIADLPRSGGNWGSWKNHSIDLPIGAMTSTTQFAFYYDDSDTYAYGAGIDNINIYENTNSVKILEFTGFLDIYPNPNNGEFEILFSSVISSDVQIIVYNIEGKRIFEKNYKNFTSEFRQKINLGNQAKGIYQLRIINGVNSVSRQITIQ